MEALRGGQSLAVDTGSVVTDEDLEQDVIGGSPLDSLFGEGSRDNSTEGTDSEDSREADSGSPEGDTNTAGDIEEILVTGPDGKRRKIKVDFNDRQSAVKNARLAAGARKWQAERDRAQAQLKKLEGSQEKVDGFNALNEAYEVGGPLAVLRAMIGEQEADQWLAGQYQRHEFRQNASEDELKYLDAQERSEQQSRELDRLKKTQEEWQQKVESEREAAEVAEVQSLFNPLFEKYRFAGKVEDANLAQELDEMVFERARANLRKLEANGVALDRTSMERAIRAAANSLRKFTNQESERKASQRVSATKEKALASAQKRTQRGYAKNEGNDKARDMIRRGDIGGFFKSFGSNIKFDD
jgi:hypothetical protein